MGAILTAAEYRAAPTAVGTNALVDGGDGDAQTAELTRLIKRAGGWIDNFVNQPLLAGTATETARLRVTRNGEFAFMPKTHSQRLVAMTAFAYGTRANALAAMSDLSGVWSEDGSWRVPIGSAVMSLPAIQFSRLAPGDEWICRYSYVYGWAGTTLTSSPIVGATSFTVADPTGITAGVYQLWDGTATEDITVTSVVGSTVNCVALANAHAAGAGLSNLPQDLKQAGICVTTAMIKTPRGSDSTVATNTLAPGQQVGVDPVGAMNLRMAREILYGYQKKR